MKGLMMHRPLKIADILTYAAESYPRGEIVSVRTEGDLHRITYAQIARRIARLSHGLKALDISMGDRIATLAWNGYRHFELYYGISGIGAICHTINPRLPPEQIIYILSHAADKLLFVDLTFMPLIEKLAAHLPKSLRFIVMTDQAHKPETGLDELLCYEDLLDGHDDHFDWPDFCEDTAAGLCYTSGTTGNPKGTLYSHRSTVLHALLVGVSQAGGLRSGNNIMPVVPLFHVNAWGLPYSAPLTGANLIFPGAALDGKNLFNLMDQEEVHSAWGVPTIWHGLLAQIAAEGRLPRGFSDIVVGGSAAPPSMIEAFEDLGVNVCHAWGMTEMSPIGTQGDLPAYLDAEPREKRLALKSMQGRRVFGVDLKIVDADGHRLAHDGKASGELYARGNTVAAAYYQNPEASAAAYDSEGWFATGDIARIDADGFLTITDRAKDLIKSGGEWISSIDLENVVMSHPDILSCAVIAVADRRWEERPLLVAVARDEAKVDKQTLLDLIGSKFSKWQIPDDVVFVEALPLTATGKVSKMTLRKQFADYTLPDSTG